jgi:hypothetical protein
MNWINPNFLKRDIFDEGGGHTAVYLAADPDECLFGQRIKGHDSEGNCFVLHFPEQCNAVAVALLTEGSRLELVHGDDHLPYDEVVASFKRLDREYIIGRSWQGHFYLHCKVDKTRGYLAAF